MHRGLGRNFAASLHHVPSSFIILISFFLVSVNWLIGLAWLAGYTGLIISRVPKEETLLEHQFGDEYGAWAARTGRFLPGIRKE